MNEIRFLEGALLVHNALENFLNAMFNERVNYCRLTTILYIMVSCVECTESEKSQVWPRNPFYNPNSTT